MEADTAATDATPSATRRSRALLIGAVIVLAALAVVLLTRDRLPAPDTTITLKEYVIAAPTTLEAGENVFLVRNTGHAHHNLTICPVSPGGVQCEGPALTHQMLRRPEDARDQSFYADESDMLVLGKRWTSLISYDLDPGTYRFYCGILGHAQNGMALEVVVEERA